MLFRLLAAMRATQICEEEYYNSRISAIAHINSGRFAFSATLRFGCGIALVSLCILRAFMLIMGFTLFRLPRPYPRPKRAFAPLQLLSILILLAVFALVARRANGYALEGSSWPAGTIVTFQMGLGSAGRTLIDGNTSWDSAAAPALGAWNNVMARLQYTDTVTSPPVSSGDGVNAVVFSNTVFGQKFGSGTLAVTSWRSSGGNITEADVLFNRNQSFDSYREIGRAHV